MVKIIAFSFTTQPDAAERFYGDVLGLKLVSKEQSALVFDNEGTMLRVSFVQEFNPQPFTILGWQVTEIRARMKELNSKGVRFERFAGFDQDELGIWTTPDGAQISWFKDPDGNLLSLTQFT